MAKILRVNMTNLRITEEEAPQQYQDLGGRALSSQMICDEVDPTCHPLGPNNKLVFAPGIVTGTAAPSSGRISVGGKSPLTGGIKESNAGTPIAQMLPKMGYKALVIEGMAPKGERYLLELTKDGASLEKIDQYIGEGLYESYPKLFEKYGSSVGIVGVGIAGEKKMSMAGICFSDAEGRPSRYSGRGGLGAVMGSKGLKYIIVDPKDAKKVELKDKDIFKEGQRKLVNALREHAVTKPGGTLNSFGTAALINVLNEAGGLPTRNFSSGTFENAQKIGGESIAALVKERGGVGTMGHACHPGCIIQCSNIFPNEDGTELVSVIEYESDWALGANCGIDNLDQIAQMVKICNDLGVDTIEAGVTLGVAMEAGLAEFGDGEKAIELLKEIGKGTPLGHILGQGAEFTGKAYGMTRIPTVKGQGMPAYEPRAVKGIGVTYITSPMGADHTAGYTIAPEILGVSGQSDPLATEGKAELSRNFQAATAFIDTSGYCLFIAFAILDIASGMEGMVETVNGVLGTDLTTDDIGRIGLDVLKKERDFNLKAGITKAHDRAPEFMTYEKLPPHNHVYDVSNEELDSVLG